MYIRVNDPDHSGRCVFQPGLHLSTDAPGRTGGRPTSFVLIDGPLCCTPLSGVPRIGDGVGHHAYSLCIVALRITISDRSRSLSHAHAKGTQ